MSDHMHRRHFLSASAGAGVALAASSAIAAPGPNEKLIVGVMGTGGRGTELSREFQRQEGVEVAYVCDVDSTRANNAAAAVEKATDHKPKAVTNYQQILDDKDVNILVIATCNHWHAPATILGCQAGKHVYVEKPCSHNPREGELMVAAARKYKKQVQLGTQRRSWPKIIEAITQVRKGVIGRAYFAQSWYQNNRPSIGTGKPGEAPAHIDYELWQGPAPRKPFRSNYLHYNWHWFWHWGNGELGNNGVHMIDLCRWGLGVDYPTRVTSSGGRYRFDDDQETPDVHVANFEFDGRKNICWEGLSCNRMTSGSVPDVIFHGEKGSLAIRGGGYTIYDLKGKEIRKESGPGGNAVHVINFLDAIRGKSPLHAEIEEGHKSTLLCHIGNIAHRLGHSLRCNPKNGHVVGDKAAMQLWSREYAKGWEDRLQG